MHVLISDRPPSVIGCAYVQVLLSIFFLVGCERTSSNPVVPSTSAPPVLTASPDGKSTDLGTPASPLDLHSALARVSADTTIELLGGIYTIGNSEILYLGRNNQKGPGVSVIRGAQGQRAIITRANGYPPYIFVRNFTQVQNIWFGGQRDTSNTPFNMTSDCAVIGCVFWGYYGCIGDAGEKNSYQDNLFVGCGRGELYHAVYLTGQPSSPLRGTLLQRNVFVGGEGYAIHLWHEPQYMTIRNNFVGDAKYSLAENGFGHVITDNVFWSNNAQPTLFFGDNSNGHSQFQFTHNLIGKLHTYYQYFGYSGQVADNNSFVQLASPGGPFGTNSKVWDESQTTSYLGKNPADINSAIKGLEQAFSQTTLSILSDSNISNQWGLIRSELNRWANPTIASGTTDLDSYSPSRFSLEQNYPNPFNPTTTIEFALPVAENAILKVYDLLGHEIITLFSGTLEAGQHRVQWDAKGMASGVYFYRLDSGNRFEMRHMLLLK